MADITLTQAAVTRNLLNKPEGRISMVSGIVGEDCVYLYSGSDRLGVSFVMLSNIIFLKLKSEYKIKKGAAVYFNHGQISTKIELSSNSAKIGAYRVCFTSVDQFALLSLTQNTALSMTIEKESGVTQYEFVPGIQYDDSYSGGLLLRNIARLITETRTMLG